MDFIVGLILIFLAILVLLVVSNVISSRGDKKNARKGGAK